MLSSVLLIHLDAVEARLASISELAALGFREEPQNWLSSLTHFEGPYRRFAIKRVFADPEKLTSKMRQSWMSIGFDVVDCAQQEAMQIQQNVNENLEKTVTNRTQELKQQAENLEESYKNIRV